MVSSPRPLIQPPRIRPYVRAAARALAGGAVGPGHRDVPGDPPQRLRRVARRRGRPGRVVVLVPVLLVGLRNDATRPELDLALPEHEGVLGARPVLDRREPEPGRRPVLVLAVRGVAGGQVLVGVAIVEEGARLVRPLLVPEAVQIVAEVPGDVGERGEPGNGISQVPALVLAARGRLGRMGRDVEDDRDDHVAIAGEPQHPFVLLPVGDVEAGEVQPGVVQALGRLRRPGPERHGEAGAGHDGVPPEEVGVPRQQRADAVHLELVQPLDAVADVPLVAPAHQPEGGGPVEVVVLARALPDEVPGVGRVHAHRPAASAVRGPERAAVCPGGKRFRRRSCRGRRA